MVFTAGVSDDTGIEIQSLSLSVQVMIDPARRGYDPAGDENGWGSPMPAEYGGHGRSAVDRQLVVEELLAELFGPPASWTPSTQGLSWARVGTAVPSFTGETAFALELPCTYDLEVAAAKYFYALEDGVVPLGFHFYGTIFYTGAEGRLQMTPVPWSSSAQFGMPVAAWRAMIDEHYPGGGWIRLAPDTLAALNARRALRGLTFDHCLRELLDER